MPFLHIVRDSLQMEPSLPVSLPLPPFLCACACACSYTVPGKRNTLLLHCSLQRSSGRMLVHTVEVNNPANDHVRQQTSRVSLDSLFCGSVYPLDHTATCR